MIRALGGFAFLLSHELRLLMRARSDPQRSGRLAILAIMLALLFGFGWFIAQLLATVTPSFTGPVLAGVTAAVVALFTLMLGHALIASTDAVYARGDLDFLLSSPFSPWTVLTVRALGIAVRVAAVYLVLASGVVFWLSVGGHWRWAGIGAGMVGLALNATAIGLMLAMVLFATIGPRATRVVAQVMGALIGASIFLAFQIPNMMSGGDRNAASRAFLKWFEDLHWSADHPLFLPARAFLGEPRALAIWTGAAIALFVVAAWWFSRRFTRDAAAVLGAGPRRRRTGTVSPFRGGATLSVVRKEWRLLLRDPVLLSQILLQLIYLAPLVFVFVRAAEDGRLDGPWAGLGAGAITAICASLAASLAWIMVSAEDAPDLISAAPLSRAAIERGKLIAAATPVFIVAALAAGSLALGAPEAGLWTFAGAALAAVSAGLIGIWHQEPGSRKDFRRRPRASWTAQLGQGFVSMAWASAAGLAAGGIPIAAIIPVVIAAGLMVALGESRRKPA